MFQVFSLDSVQNGDQIRVLRMCVRIFESGQNFAEMATNLLITDNTFSGFVTLLYSTLGPRVTIIATKHFNVVDDQYMKRKQTH